MKYFFALLAVSAGLLTPLSVQANPNLTPRGVPVDQINHKTHKNVAPARPPKTTLPIYYITSYTPTGSHIPMVVCRYQGRYYPMNSFAPDAVYTQGDIGLSGSLNVGGALRTLDPAISSVR